MNKYVFEFPGLTNVWFKFDQTWVIGLILSTNSPVVKVLGLRP